MTQFNTYPIHSSILVPFNMHGGILSIEYRVIDYGPLPAAIDFATPFRHHTLFKALHTSPFPSASKPQSSIDD